MCATVPEDFVELQAVEATSATRPPPEVYSQSAPGPHSPDAVTGCGKTGQVNGSWRWATIVVKGGGLVGAQSVSVKGAGRRPQKRLTAGECCPSS